MSKLDRDTFRRLQILLNDTTGSDAFNLGKTRQIALRFAAHIKTVGEYAEDTYPQPSPLPKFDASTRTRQEGF